MTRKDKTLTTIYRQMDGYPSGHGADLKAILADFQICNGISLDQANGKWANGMGCLAMQLIKELKEGIGGFYLMRPDAKDVWEEYTYILTENKEHGIDVEVREVNGKKFKTIYKGPIKDFPAESLG